MNEQAVDYLQQAITLMGKPDYEQAERLVRKALEIESRYAEAHSVLGDIYANQENFDKALEEYRKVLLIDPEYVEAYFDIGNVYFLKDELVKGIEYYNKADEKGYRNYELYRNLAKLYEQLGNEELTLRNYNRAIREEPLMAELRLEKIEYEIGQGRFLEALEALEELQGIEPDLYDAYAIRAEVLMGLSRFEEAHALITKAAETFPDDVALPVLKAKILTRMGRMEAAKKELDAIKGSESYGVVSRSARFLEAQLALSENNFQEAEGLLRQVIQDGQTYDEQAQYLLMNVCYGMKEYDKTLEIAESLSQREAYNLFTVSGKYFRPFILKKQGNMTEAAAGFRKLSAELRRVTVKNPHFYEGYLYRLLCHKELGEFEKALELADYIEALDNTSTDSYALRYSIYQDMGDSEKAEEMKKIVQKINPGLEL